MIAFLTCGEFHLRPIKRLAAYTVFSALVMACRLAMCPTSRLPASVTATTLGVVLYPPRFGITTGVSPSKMATQEFVVPRSMPITRSILSLSHHQAVEPSGLAAFEPTYPVSDSIILGRQRRGTLEFRQAALLHTCRHVDSGQSHPRLGFLAEAHGLTGRLSGLHQSDRFSGVVARNAQVTFGHQGAVGCALEGAREWAAQRRPTVRARGLHEAPFALLVLCLSQIVIGEEYRGLGLS